MSRAQVAIAVWGLLVLGLAVVMWVEFFADALSFILPAGAALLTWAAAAWAIRWNTRRPGVERVTDLSPSTAIAAIGLSVAVVGAEVGPWMLAMGAGTLVAGLIGLVGEQRTR
jgi:Mn2+/Fe2+ NRAMP family transporter